MRVLQIIDLPRLYERFSSNLTPRVDTDVITPDVHKERKKDKQGARGILKNKKNNITEQYNRINIESLPHEKERKEITYN